MQFYKIDFLAQEKAFYSSPHSHKHFEIFYFQKGNAHHHIDFKSYLIKDHSAFLISLNQVHYIEAPIGSHNIGYVISFGQDFLELLERDFQELFNADAQNPAFYLQKEDHELLWVLLKQIERELASTLPKGNQLVFSAVTILITHLYRQNISATSQINHPHSRTFSQFLYYLERHICSKHTVREYADLLAVSPKTLNRMCRQLKSQTCLQIILSRLNLEAKRLLFYSQEPIKEVAFQIGFNDPAYFSNFFKKLNGQSPESFRLQMSQIYK